MLDQSPHPLPRGYGSDSRGGGGGGPEDLDGRLLRLKWRSDPPPLLGVVDRGTKVHSKTALPQDSSPKKYHLIELDKRRDPE